MLRPFSWLHWDEVLSTAHLYNLEKSERKAKKRGQYKKYSPAQRSDNGRYSSVHGAAATAKHFSKLWGCKLNDSTVNSIKKAYLDELVISRAFGMHGIYYPQPSKLWEACNLSNQTTNWLFRLLSNGNTTRAL